VEVISQLLEAENFFGWGLKSLISHDSHFISGKRIGEELVPLSRGGDFLSGDEAVIEHGGQGVAVHAATVSNNLLAAARLLSRLRRMRLIRVVFLIRETRKEP